MITVCHLLQSRSERGIWLMEELAEPYETLYFKRKRTMESPEAYRALHPMGTSPIVRDGDLSLVETGHLIRLWQERNARVLPYLDQELAARPYFAGEAFAAADIMMGFNFGLAKGYIGARLEDFPQITAYCDRIFARPAYVRSRGLVALDDADEKAASGLPVRRFAALA